MRRPDSLPLRVAFASALVSGLVAGLVWVGPPASAQSPPRLSLFKQIENLDTGASFGDRSAWDVQAMNVDTGDVTRGQGLNGVQSVEVAAGTYEISEIATDATPPGYRFDNWSCDGEVTTEPTRSITLVDDQNLTCTVTNVAVKPTLTLVKVVDGGALTPDQWTLQALDGPTFVGGPGNSPDVTDVEVRPGQYRLAEEGPGGYEASPWTCAYTDTEGGSGSLPVGADGGIEIELGQAVTCSITNTSSQPLLSLAKEVTGPAGMPVGDPAEWTLSATGPTPISGVTGSADVTLAGVDAGAYTLAEAGGPLGYVAGAWACTDRVTDTTLPVSAAGVVDVAAGQDVLCTIANDFQGGWLTLVKQVDGNEEPDAWTLTADGPTTVSGPGGDPSIVQVPVPVGDYALSEDGPTAGWASDGWQCSGSDAIVDSVTVAQGADITCTIVNQATSAFLSLTKFVGNQGGGTLQPEAWTLSATGPVSFSGPSGSDAVDDVAVTPGTYTLGESSLEPDAGFYEPAPWFCRDDDTGVVISTGPTITIADQQSVSCTIVNVWTRSTLTLNKSLAASAGTPASPDEFVLQATGDNGDVVVGPANTDATTNVPIPGGVTWTLEEVSGPPGYAPTGWTCSGGIVDGDTITIEGGVNAFCTITNVAILPTLTLQKLLDNTGGGTAEVSDFFLKTRGPGDAAFEGFDGDPSITGVQAPPGEYVFSEEGPNGYTVTWTCEGTTFDAVTELATLVYGEDAICTATNVAVPPSLSIEKVVDGGDAAPTDWTVSADGPTPISGLGAASGDPVDAGTYALSETPGAGTPGLDDYLPGDWACTSDGVEPLTPIQTGPGTAEVTLPLDVAASCSIANTFAPPVLTLVKEVDDGPDGPGALPENWVLAATGTGTADGTDVSGPGGSPDISAQVVTSGTYELSEAPSDASPPPSVDYAASDWTCSGTGFEAGDLVSSDDVATLDLQAGDDVTCSIRNIYDPPRLTLVKEVLGGPLTAEDWTLTWTSIDDPSHTGSGVVGDSLVTGYPVEAGTFALSLSSGAAEASDYTASDWSCDGGELVPPDRITLVAEDLEVTCTITSTYDPPPDPPPDPTPDPSPDPTPVTPPAQMLPPSVPPDLPDTGVGGGPVPSGGGLPTTGSDVASLLTPALLAIGLGLGLRLWSRRTRVR